MAVRAVSFFLGGVEIRLSFWFFLLASLLLMADQTGMSGLFLAAIAVHEGGHLLYLLLARLPLGGASLSPLGFILSLAPGCRPSTGQSLLLNLSGCGANFLIAAALAFFPGGGMRLLRLSAVNTALGLANLLPVPGLDGGQALEDLLVLLLGWERGSRLHTLLTRGLCLAGAVICGWMVLLRGARGAIVWLTLVFFAGCVRSR